MNENEEIKEAVEDLEELSQDYELRRLAELKEKYIRDKKAEDAYCREQGLEAGRKQGLEEGRKQGLEEGHKEGREEERVKIVKKMIEEQMDIELIIKVTGLTKEEIEKITFLE